MIASRSAKKALAEQLAPPLVEEKRFDEWLSRHAQYHLILVKLFPMHKQMGAHHVIAGRSAKKALAEQPAPVLAEEERFGEYLSRHAPLPVEKTFHFGSKDKLPNSNSRFDKNDIQYVLKRLTKARLCLAFARCFNILVQL